MKAWFVSCGAGGKAEDGLEAGHYVLSIQVPDVESDLVKNQQLNSATTAELSGQAGCVFGLSREVRRC